MMFCLLQNNLQNATTATDLRSALPSEYLLNMPKDAARRIFKKD